MYYRRRATQRAIDVLIAAAAAAGSCAWANPQGGVVAAGSATITSAPGLVNIQQTSPRAITNWRSFDIGKGEQVRIQQPSSTSALLARVTGGLGRSSLDGLLQANGQFFLINPQGVIVGRDAVIDTGAFLATTLSVTDRDFLTGGALRFVGDSDAGIVNLGAIRASNGDVTLVARSVKNAGTIGAPQGAATLAAATEFLLSSPDQPTLLVRGTAARTEGTAVDNEGLIAAAKVRMQAAGGDMYSLAVNQAGVVRATGVRYENGSVVLTADSGGVDVSGTVSAHSAEGSGGSIHIGGGLRGGDAAVPNATDTRVAASAVIDVAATSTKGSGGTVTVWAERSTSFEGTITARGGAMGGDGGFAEVSGKQSLVFKPAAPVDLRAPAGRMGTLLLDPDELTITSDATAANKLNAGELQTQLGSGNVELNTSTAPGDISFEAPVAWGNASTLTVRSGNNINVNADITAAGGTLKLYAGRPAFYTDIGQPDLEGRVNMASSATIKVDKLVVGSNAQSNVPLYAYQIPESGTIELDGKLDVGTLELELDTYRLSVAATHSQNRITALNSTGTGDIKSLDVSAGTGGIDVTIAASAESLQIVAPGDVTLKAGTALTLPLDTRAVIASTAGNFKNEAGASAITGDGSFLAYTGSTGLTAKDGLTGTDEFGRSLAGNPPGDYTDGVSRFLFRASGGGLPDLTYRADDKSRTYGDANPGLTFSISDIDGPVAPASLAGQVTGAPELSTTATQTSNAQQYTILITQGTLDSTAYAFNFVNGKLTVQPAPLVVTASNASRSYGSSNPSFTGTVTGLKNSDTAGDILAGLDFSSSATRSSSVGTYSITGGHDSAPNPNYSYTFNNGTLRVRPAPVTITLPQLSREYGDANPVFLTFAEASGLKNLQSLSEAFPSLAFSTTAGTASPVGSYAVLGTGATNPNYSITTDFRPLQVIPAVITVAATSASRLFGDANPVLSATVSGFRNGDTEAVVSNLSVGTSAIPSSPIGSYPVTGSGASAPNYSFSYLPGTLTVTPAGIVVTVANASRVFGDANPAFTYSVSGLRNGDTAGSFAAASVAAPLSPVGNYAITGSGSQPNYSVSFVPGVLSVAKRPVVFTANNQTRIYGDANPALTFTSSGLLAADEIYRNYWQATTAATQAGNAGAYPIAMGQNPAASSIVSIFTNLPNYEVQYVNGTMTVQRAPLILTAQSVQAMWGDARPQLTYTVVSGLRMGDSPSVLSGVKLTTAPDVMVNGTPVEPLPKIGAPEPTPGRYPITFFSTGTAQNYEVTQAFPAAFTVTPRPYVVNVPDATVYSNNLVGNTFGFVAPELLANGPQFKILLFNNAPQGTTGGQYTLAADLAPGGPTRQDISRYYNLDFRDTGVLTIVPPPEPVVFALPTAFTLTPSTVPPVTPEVKLTVATVATGFTAQQMSDLVRANPADMTAALRQFIYDPTNTNGNGYSTGFRQLTDEQRRFMLDLLTGKATWDEAATGINGNPTMRAALGPVMALYAMDLVSRNEKMTGPLSDAQRQLVKTVEAKMNEQHLQAVATAEASYAAWGENNSMEVLFNRNFPDFVSGARQAQVSDILMSGAGLIGGTAAGTAAAAAGYALAATLLPNMAHGLAAATAGLTLASGTPQAMTAMTAAGPIGIAVGAVVIVGMVAGQQAKTSAENAASYSAFIASKNQKLSFGEMDVVHDLTSKQLAFTAVLGVINAF